MPLYAYFPNPPNGDFIDRLHERLNEGIRIAYGRKLPDPDDYDVLVSGRPSDEYLSASDKIKSLVIPYAGVPNNTRTLMGEYPKISVHNLHHNAAPTAEMALTLMLAAAKSVVVADRELRTGSWMSRYGESGGMLLEGRTLLLLGYGAVGRRIARSARALGMRVIAVRRGGPLSFSDHPDELHGPEDLDLLLPRANVVLCTLPDTEETHGLIGAPELALLPTGAVLVNVGRGPVVDEQALYDALKSGRLAAAGLDVWYRYPKSEAERDSTWPCTLPFHELDNVVMSPHRGGITDLTDNLRAAHLASLLNAAAAGEPMPNRVNLGRGY